MIRFLQDHSLFVHAGYHIAVVKALAKRKMGLTRTKILETVDIPEGGSIQRTLEELEQSGFIGVYPAFGKKKKERLYRLVDEYSLFYLQLIERRIFQDKQVWEKLSQSPSYTSWGGYAFEGICLKHIECIATSLEISGIYYEATSFFRKANDEVGGVQIDLLIDRNDQVVNLFEIKFSNTPFGFQPNIHSDGLIQHDLSLDDLFKGGF